VLRACLAAGRSGRARRALVMEHGRRIEFHSKLQLLRGLAVRRVEGPHGAAQGNSTSAERAKQARAWASRGRRCRRVAGGECGREETSTSAQAWLAALLLPRRWISRRMEGPSRAPGVTSRAPGRQRILRLLDPELRWPP
jgi:hypothetical protein